MTDLQCAKLVYAGQKFRILGRVSTSVQCIFDGAPAGNTHFKALVVQDLYQNLDTHSIAGQKLSDKLKGPPYELLSEPEENKTPTEPTKKIQKPSLEPSKSRKRKKVSKTAPSVSTDDEIVSDSSDPPPSPRPKCQGKWTRNQYYHGWHPTHGYGRDNLKTSYENRKTGSVTFDTPAEWYSDGSLHSLATVDRNSSRDSSDEYSDEYTNISTIRFNDDDPEKRASAKTGHASPDPSTVGDWIIPVPGPPDSLGPARASLFTTPQLARRRRLFKSGKNTPPVFRHVPVPHGADWCDEDCLLGGRPPECGYHPRFGKVKNCSARCAGGWCQHTRQMNGRDYMS